jgi:HlyD family secretion protein
MAHFAQRLTGLARTPRGRILMAVAGLALVALLWLVFRGAFGGSERTGAEQTLVVQPTPFSVASNFTGKVSPGDSIEVVAPFDAAVARVRFAYGDQVAAGQILIELNAADVARGRAEAEAAWLGAQDLATRMQTWDSSPEMSRAARNVAVAESDLDDVQRKVQESKALLDRGLVPRSEYEGLQQQERARRMALVQAREELEVTRRRGQGVERRIAVLKRDAALSQYTALGGDAGSATIRAPASGVIVRPRAGRPDGTDDSIHAGVRVSAGQSLGVVARIEGLDVTFQLDEGDVNAVRPGQIVTVTGPGFGGLVLKGRVSGVAGEATAGPAGAKSMFTAAVRLDPLTPEQAQRVRIGMTANVSIVAYEKASALVVPPEAVQGAAPQTWLMVRSAPGGRAQRVPVIIGRVGPGGVEIVAGLKAGDTVVWSTPAPPAVH